MRMTQTKTACPDPQCFRIFLEGACNDVLQRTIVDHVQQCHDCQRTLETLTDLDSEADWSDSQRKAWANISTEDGRIGSLDQRMDLSDLASETGTLAGIATCAIERPGILPQPLQILGYQIFEPIATGGMGTVYRARHNKLNRDVAIKVIRSAAGADAVTRFHREMSAVGKMEHDHIVRGYDAGETSEGIPYIVMELLNGDDLGHRIKSADQFPISIADACRYAHQAALGLQAAHDAGLIHRDVKPSNLMLTAAGKLKLLDLGLVNVQQPDGASPIDGETTNETAILGSLDYIAPEQGRDTSSADARSDVYSLGCTLFALLTGNAPFAGAQFDTASKKLLAHACESRPDPQALRSDVPQELADIIRQMMSIDPNDRPQSAVATADLLLPFCDPAAQTNAVPSTKASGGNSHRFSGRNVAAAMGGMFLLLGVIILVRLKDGTTQRIEIDKPVASVTVENTDNGIGKEPAAVVPKESIPSKPPAIDRAQYPHYVRTLSGHTNRIQGFCFGVTSNEAWSSGMDRKILRWNLETGSSQQVYDFGAQRPRRGLAVTADNKSLLFSTDNHLKRWDLEKREIMWERSGQIEWLKVYPKDNLFLGLHEKFADVFQWCGLDDGVVMKSHVANWTSAWAQISPDGKSILCTAPSNNRVFIGSLDDDRTKREFLAKDFKPRYAAFSPDMQHVIGMDETSRMVIWDAKSNEVIENRKPAGAIQRTFLIPISGTKLFLSALGSNALIIWDPLTGTDHTQIPVPLVGRFVLSNDGKYVLTMGQGAALKLWRLPDLPRT